MNQKFGRIISILTILFCVIMLVLSITIKFGGEPFIWITLLICNCTILISQYGEKKGK